MQRTSIPLWWAAIAALSGVSCSTPPPVHTGPLPEVPKKWPQEDERPPEGTSRGWMEMCRLWNRALEHPLAGPAEIRKLRRIGERHFRAVTFRWLSPALALGAYRGTYGAGGTFISVYELKGGQWSATRTYSRNVDISCYFPVLPVDMKGEYPAPQYVGPGIRRVANPSMSYIDEPVPW